MRKRCQIEDIRYPKLWICGKVLDKTKQCVFVLRSRCERCTEESLQRLIRDVRNNQRMQVKTSETLLIFLHFGKAMIRALKTGFKKIQSSEYKERLICCTTCTKDVNKCPYCGCNLKGQRFSKAILASEQGCPNPKTYPGLRKYPPRNFWGVCKETTTVLIACRNESVEHLHTTINSIISNATGKLEVIVLLDGKINPKVRDRRVRVIKFDNPVGRRVAYNVGAAQAKGDYLFFVDSHCTMSEGWDTKLKCACGERTLAASTIASLTTDMEERKKGHYSFVSLDRNLQDKWWGAKKKELLTPTIARTMAFTGCGWMIRRDYFLQLDGFDELLGEYGHTGSEWSVKVQCGPVPGTLVLRTDVTCGHVFGTNTLSALYKPYAISQDEFKKRMYVKYGE